MSELILTSFKVQNFRAFDDLVIEKLGRVNLIVGKNSVGKTCLLDALSLYAHRGNPGLIWDMLSSRDEYTYSPVRGVSEPESYITNVRHIFNGREEQKDGYGKIYLGSLDDPEKAIRISLDYYVSETNEEGIRTLHLVRLPEEFTEIENAVLRFTVEAGEHQKQSYHIDPDYARRRMGRPELREIKSTFIPANGLDRRQVAALWDSITLTDAEADVLSSLQVIDQDIERLSLVGEREGPSERYPLIKVATIENPVPLKSMGGGLVRAFGITLALVNVSNGILLIDEFESGLHYSVQYDLWRLVLSIARRLNVQVFATTHSWDCVEAFQQASIEEKSEEGMLIRMEKKGSSIVPTLFDERRLSIATREQIEIR